MRNFFVQHEQNQQLHQLKKITTYWNTILAELFPYILVFLYFNKIEGVSRYTK